MALIRAEIEGGTVEGMRAGFPFYTIFKGVPFMAPPVGELRWRAPQPVKPWQGVLPCTKFKPTAMQPPFGSGGDLISQEFMGAPVEMAEDCMYLNIWTPAQTPAEKLPVMVYIHGGGWQTGYSYLNAYDGEGFCKRGVIMVTIPWRVGAFGFLAHPALTAESGYGSSGNYGYLDQIFALAWVQRNIAAFGGDPAQVTIFGQSAGAGAVRAMCASPLAKGLFRRAIMQSIGAIVHKPHTEWCKNLATQEALGKHFFEFAGFESLAAARACPAEQLLKHIMAFNSERRYPEDAQADWYAGGVMRFGPTEVDGYVFRKSPAQTFQDGEQADVDYMTGSTADEFPFMTVGTLAFAENQSRLKKPAPYIYYFSYVPPTAGGAHHSVEHHYVFQTLLRSRRPYGGFDFELSNELADRWAAFAKSGVPNCAGKGYDTWVPFTAQEPLALCITAKGCHMAIHPRLETDRPQWEAELK